MENFSVIVSVYNRLDYLRKALLSIQNQSVVPAEVVVSDDGSHEPIREFLRELAPQFSFRLKLIRQEDKGFRLARCKNNGIRAAENDFLVFWDQDVIATPGYLEVYWKHRQPGQFLVSYPVRLSEVQTKQLSEENIRAGNFAHLLTGKQIKKIHSQYRKDGFYYWYRKLLNRRDTRPKLRGGIFAIFKDDLLKVNGFDENYQGWGNEDDDLGRRLYACGVAGRNPFYDQFPLHLYHPPYHVNGQRVNSDYYRQRLRAIKKGDFKALNGIENPLGNDPVLETEFK